MNFDKAIMNQSIKKYIFFLRDKAVNVMLRNIANSFLCYSIVMFSNIFIAL